MADKKIVLRILVMALVFGLFVVGCNNDVGTWKGVTDMHQLNGKWKASYDKEDSFRLLLNYVENDVDVDEVNFLPFYSDGSTEGVLGYEEDDYGFVYDYNANKIPLKIYLSGVTVKNVGTTTDTYEATDNNNGTRRTINSWTRVYSGDSLDQEFGYACNGSPYEDADNTVRTGWDLIKAFVAGKAVDPFNALEDGYTVDNKNYTIKFTSPETTPASPLTLNNTVRGILISPDKTQLIRSSNLYTKQ